MTVDSRQLLHVLEEHTRRLASSYEIADAIHDLAEGAREVFGVAGAGVSLASGDRLVFATAHPELVTRIERVQEETQQGPCVDAHHTERSVVVSDIHAERERWPELAAEASEQGLCAVAGIPMLLAGTSVGVLNLYSDSPREWDDDDLHAAEVLAAMASALIANADRRDTAQVVIDQLQQALESRVLIEQAKGMIANERDTSIDAAFELLRSHARSHQVTLRSVAEAVVKLRLRL